MIIQQLEINTLKSIVGLQQAEITRQQAEIEQLKAENARLKGADEERERQLEQMRAADNTRGIDMNRLKERSTQVHRLAETLKEKHDDMREWYNSCNTIITDGVKKITDGFEFVRRHVNILWGDRCKQQEVLKKRDHVSMQITDVEDIVYEGNDKKSSYVREDGTEFAPLNEEWLKENVDVIDEQLKNRDTSDNALDAFTKWRKQFLSKVSKPLPAEVEVDYLQYEKENLHGKIICWMFVKEIHCMEIKREYALTKLELIISSNFEGAMLFARKIKMKKRTGWKDELYKPQFPIYQQIKFTLDPSTNTARYKLVYQPTKVMEKIPLMPMKQNFLEDMALWCYESDTHEAFRFGL
ncbi:hypothetical protein Hanom_Chr06g00528341 [Helianthus anomalus]